MSVPRRGDHDVVVCNVFINFFFEDCENIIAHAAWLPQGSGEIVSLSWVVCVVLPPRECPSKQHGKVGYVHYE